MKKYFDNAEIVIHEEMECVKIGDKYFPIDGVDDGVPYQENEDNFAFYFTEDGKPELSGGGCVNVVAFAIFLFIVLTLAIIAK